MEHFGRCAQCTGPTHRRDTLAITPTGQGQPSFQEHWVYRGEQIGQVSVTTPLTSFTETFLYRPNGSPLELVYKTAGQASKRYWYVLDGHNNVMGLVDGSGTLVNVYTYDVWGRPDLTTPGATREAVPQPLRYQGYWYDGWDNSGDSGGASWNSGPMPWYWLQVRSYDPSLRRFLQPDPLTGGGLPSYAYANDDPLDVHDPTGQAGVPAACGCQEPDESAQGSGGERARGDSRPKCTAGAGHGPLRD